MTTINFCTFCDSATCAHVPAFNPYNVRVPVCVECGVVLTQDEIYDAGSVCCICDL